MNITAVKCLVLDGQYLFVKVFTDVGLVGIGECFRRQLLATKAVIEEVLAPAVVGADAMQTEAVWHRMHRTVTAIGVHGFSATAMAGVDIALWDLKGKALGVPIYQLLGGKVRDRIRVYASSLRRDLTPLEEAQRAASFAEAGYTAYKLHSAVPGAIDDPADQTIETVREVRRAVGDRFDILVDVNGAYSPHHAIEVGKQLEDCGVCHFEEPVPFYDLPGLAQVADALALPIAAGEMQYNRWQFRDLILQGRVDILMPDVIKAGGLSELQKIAALASACNKPISTHNTQPTVCTAANVHFCAVHQHASYAHEYNIEPVSIRDEWPILKTPLEVKDGHIALPEGPGLGIELDDAMVRRLAAQ
ncbi:D-galactarolactone cycloisomerase [Candidatus Entotheonellaceae bacterium PAL068K]